MLRISLTRQTLGSLFWMAVGIFFMFGACDLEIGSINNPGPAFLPVCMAILLICLNLVDLLATLRMRTRNADQLIWRRPLFVVCSLFCYLPLFSFFGFFISTYSLMLFLFGLLIPSRNNKWRRVALYSGLTSLTAWLVFAKVLGMYL
jgi:hypothetical protein